jgi:hypothetical protein
MVFAVIRPCLRGAAAIDELSSVRTLTWFKW